MNRIRIEQLPKAGYVILQLKSSFLFEPYTVKDGKLLFRGSEYLEKEPMTECHFFSRDREYRLIARKSRGEQEMLVKKEFISRDDLPEKLLVINRYVFTENDTLALQDYRISCP